MPLVQTYILPGRPGERLALLKQSRAEGMTDFIGSLVDLVEREYIHTQVALGATPKHEKLKMRLNGISQEMGRTPN